MHMNTKGALWRSFLHGEDHVLAGGADDKLVEAFKIHSAIFSRNRLPGNQLANLHFDPQLVPIVSLAGEASLQPERLQADWLRLRFANPPRWLPEFTDEHRLRMAEKSLVRASVLIPVVAREQGLTVLLTQRADHLNEHGGQISFPGGRVEETDLTAIETALRETEEEIGLDRRHVEVIGELPEYFTGTGYRIAPVAALVHPPFDLEADPFEVAEIFEVPLAFLMDGANHQKRLLEYGNENRQRMEQRTFYAMPYEQHFIWGATAGILRNLFHFLRA